MTEIVKICSLHGQLTREQININRNGVKSYFRCKQCQNESHRKYFLSHRQEVNLKCAEYRKKDPEKWKSEKRKSFLKNGRKPINKQKKSESDNKHYYKNHELTKEKNRKRKRQYSKHLRDCYVRGLLIRSGISADVIDSNLVSIKRVTLKIKRIKKAYNDT